MNKPQFKVQVLKGWMIGIHTYPTKQAALDFYDRWLQVAINEGDLEAHKKIKWLVRSE